MRHAHLTLVLALALIAPGCGSGGTDPAPDVGPKSNSASAALARLVVTGATLGTPFDPSNTRYRIGPGMLQSTLTFQAEPNDPNARLFVDGVETRAGVDTDIDVSIGSRTVSFRVESADGSAERTYDVQIDREAPVGQAHYLKASNPGSDDRFGTAVAISGDTIVIGTTGEDSPATGINGDDADLDTSRQSGAAYVYTIAGGRPVLQAHVKEPADVAGPARSFGWAVAIDGDLMVVGGPLQTYAYERIGNTWMLQDRLDVSGHAVAIEGTRIVVGDIGDASGDLNDPADTSAPGSGAVYVFERDGREWAQEAWLKAPNVGSRDSFGFKVDLSGDTLVVGAPFEDSSATTRVDDNDDAEDAGAAYVYVRRNGAWQFDAYLKHTHPDVEDFFGYDVAVSGGWIAVGAYGDDSGTGDPADNSAMETGACFVYSGAPWTLHTFLKSALPYSFFGFSSFGWSVDLEGDSLLVGDTRDGWMTIGADGTPTGNATNSGAAQLFGRTGATWTLARAFKAMHPDASDIFGWGVALDGNTVVAGAPGESGSSPGPDGDQEDDSLPSAGAVFIYR